MYYQILSRYTGGFSLSTNDKTVYLALGSNIGDRWTHLTSAIMLLHPHIHVDGVSSVYETEPAYVSDQPRFLNMVLCGVTRLDPVVLLAVLKDIECKVGRAEGPRNGPRIVDLDILLYDDQTIYMVDLIIPHPRMAERPFVLVPLAEIAPDAVPPGWQMNVQQAASTVSGHGDIIACVGRFKVNAKDVVYKEASE
ncbi:MAG: GTP cyclohydrolase I FolE2 [Chloroflexi bacterium AL-W]|nr:GTP cyclohydrolase I FolE2 [Chloroflexi bacterium AL-N1]NOK71127.1 GTP cyclohydrolase I FolE2 [Chloroflexi bacterium AL-N10]NOK78593.1 GTP cyclohydrolase I FolE2 [Chloroflexi bacterium AL-N5]NOK85889.1 GTP cyclohydrolase I FolE2 [Chloroflexi bacterium AL-W]NOK92864.1 GTP cyclohydrolase I FolE2 [Chloroflexi bacterium AL-N15]